ncbi:branched-chain amino acid transport system II carrier protein [Lacrimispora algidixylanolytica]|uniref:Branched-chain amino acid transport system carrier protein n=1 Tax=Lacrimispora algidixylanolytica TaxID=94868 RepID=A0A419T602_9FIRM|nr:branched-chain amino acid transport system II carrier protein [Lacrimispora algidixylanolytica]RKD32828.1 branched-chain amino acid transport system II carrier protein [Lacrimispora algidixylanolytica]
MDKLSTQKRILIGLTLFSMFFGAGNLIFPPFLGSLAGTNTWTAMIGFAVTAIGFPVLGVVSVARAGGFYYLAERVHPRFAYIFTLLNYLSIGPCLAIPRTASTSFEMAVVPFMGDGNPLVAQLLYSAAFFVVAFVVALNPDQLTNRLGKILTPVLLVLIVVIFAGCLIKPPGLYGAPVKEYASAPFVKGFLDGYLTMDTIAALNFGIVISLNIKAMGMKKDAVVVKETIHAGFVAGGILLLVYGALAHVGSTTGGAFGSASNGAQTLNQAVSFLYGKVGLVMLAVVFFIACLNTCIGLISCCSKYFCTIIPGIGYRTWAFIFALSSFVISNIGLTKILEISVPVLNTIYPVAIVLILLSFAFQDGERWRMVYVSSIGITGVVSVLLSLEQAGAKILHQLLLKLPLYAIGLGWIVPALVGVFFGMFLATGRESREV